MSRSVLRTPEDLAAAGLVAPGAVDELRAVTERYAVAITPDMAALIDRADPADPIARQFVPDRRELETSPVERSDPIGDDAHAPLPGLVHRHPDRVLLKLTGICPVYCRFCFRREMIGPAAGRELGDADLERAIGYIAARPGISEVILTGGDPLVLSPRRIAAVTAALGSLEHVEVLRWHTRVPVVSPERVSAELVAALTCAERPVVYLAIHANHPRELTPAATAQLRRLRRAGIVLLSQTVLLAGINDDLETLTALMRTFVAHGVKPYYLHHPDLAPGTAHLRVSIRAGQRLVEGLRGALSGLAQPTYVLDIPGGVSKVAIGEGAVVVGEGMIFIRDPSGRLHHYPSEASHD